MPIVDGINPSGPQPDAGGGGGGTDIISAIVGAAAMAYSAYQSRKAGQEANAANRSLAEYGYAQDLAQWNRSNEYNSPLAQMQRFSEAGLNPNLIYGGGAAGAAGNTSTTSPKYNAPTIQPVASGIPGQIPQMLMLHQDIQMKQAQIDNVKAHTDNVQNKTVTESLRPELLNSQTENIRLGMSQSARRFPYRLEGEKSQATILKHGELKSEAAANNEWRRFAMMDQEMQLNVLRVDQMKRNLTATNLENLKRKEDIIFKKNENQWRAAGVTSSDNLFLRMLTRQLDINNLIQDFSKPYKPKGGYSIKSALGIE